MTALCFTLNGQPVDLTGVDPHMTLLQYLRSTGLTGAKEGCAEGECGACAVVLLAPCDPPRYTAVNSCLLLLPMLAGREVYTVEALARSQHLHPVQSALVQAGGSQCGYCTPGFVMSLFAEYYRPGRTDWDPEALSGNLCRCTGYRAIQEAAGALGTPAAADPFLPRRAAVPLRPVPLPPVPLPPVALPSVACEGGNTWFFRPRDLAAVSALLQTHPDAALVAGGTDLAVEINQRARRWPVLISLEGIEELRTLTWTADAVEMGSGLTLSELEEELAGRVPLLTALFPLFASRPVRNRATLGGSLATASPVGDAAPALLALGAEVRLAGGNGRRLLPLAEFFTGYRRTALQPGEVLAAVRIPLPLPQCSRFYKVARRRRDDISTVSAAFALDRDDRGRVSRVRLAYGGVAATPARAEAAEAALLGQVWDAAALQEVGPVLAEGFQPISDHRGSAAYRQKLVLRLLEKFYYETRGESTCV